MDPHQLEMEKFKHQLWKFAMQTVQKLDSQDEKEKIPERTTEQKNSAEELQQKLFERGNPLTRRDTYEGRLYSALWWVIARLKTCLAGRDLEKKNEVCTEVVLAVQRHLSRTGQERKNCADQKQEDASGPFSGPSDPSGTGRTNRTRIRVSKTQKKHQVKLRDKLAALYFKNLFLVPAKWKQLNVANERLKQEFNLQKLHTKLLFRKVLALGLIRDLGLIQDEPADLDPQNQPLRNSGALKRIPPLFQFPMALSKTAWARDTAHGEDVHVVLRGDLEGKKPFQSYRISKRNEDQTWDVIGVDETNAGEQKTIRASDVFERMRLFPMPSNSLLSSDDSRRLRELDEIERKLEVASQPENSAADVSGNTLNFRDAKGLTWTSIQPALKRFSQNVLGVCQFLTHFDLYGPAFNHIQHFLNQTTDKSTSLRQHLELGESRTFLNVALYLVGDLHVHSNSAAAVYTCGAGSGTKTGRKGGSAALDGDQEGSGRGGDSPHGERVEEDEDEDGGEDGTDDDQDVMARDRVSQIEGQAISSRSRSQRADPDEEEKKENGRPGIEVCVPKSVRSIQRFSHMRSALMFVMEAMVDAVLFLQQAFKILLSKNAEVKNQTSEHLESLVVTMKVMIGKNFDLAGGQKQTVLKKALTCEF